jgi:hypothetical protein
MLVIPRPRLVRPAIGPYNVNRSSEQARGITGWWPMHIGGVRTTPLVTRQANIIQPDQYLRDHNAAASSDYHQHVDPEAEFGLSAAWRSSGNYEEALVPGTWANFITQSTGSISCWFRADANGPSSASAYTLLNVMLDQGGYFGLSYGNRASAGQGIHAYNFTGSGETFVSDLTLVQGRWYHVVLVHAGGVLYLYVNGVLSGSTASGDTLTISGPSPGVGTFGLSTTNQIRVADVRVYNVGLSPGVVRAMYEPATRWELYGPRKLYYPISAAAGTSGTIAVTEAADAMSASGTSTVTGTIAVTEANDAPAMSGTSTVAGTIAVTEAADTMSASGTSAIAGTIAVTEAADAMSAIGTSAIAGTIAVTEASDAMTATGVAGSVSGSMAVTEAADTMSASGFVGDAVLPQPGIVTGATRGAAVAGATRRVAGVSGSLEP